MQNRKKNVLSKFIYTGKFICLQIYFHFYIKNKIKKKLLIINFFNLKKYPLNFWTSVLKSIFLLYIKNIKLFIYNSIIII